MRQTYPLFIGREGAANASALIGDNRIALFLDGLDEMADELRPVALRALSQQATFRLVVLSRTAELASAAARQGPLYGAAAVELRPIDHATAAQYLSLAVSDPPPQGWRDLLSRMRSDQPGPIARALDNPLMLTLVRDTYRGQDDVLAHPRRPRRLRGRPALPVHRRQMGLSKLDVLRQLFTTGPWLPPAAAPP